MDVAGVVSAGQGALDHVPNRFFDTFLFRFVSPWQSDEGFHVVNHVGWRRSCWSNGRWRRSTTRHFNGTRVAFWRPFLRFVVQGQEGFVPRSFKIESLDSAGNAVKTMVEDSSQAGCPQNSNMSVVQWQGQLAQHCEGTTSGCVCLAVPLTASRCCCSIRQVGERSGVCTAGQVSSRVFFLLASPLRPSIDAALLVATARQLALNTGNMLAAAHSTAVRWTLLAVCLLR